MNPSFMRIGILLSAFLLVIACAKPQYVLEETRPTLAEIKTRDSGYVRNTVLAPQTETPGSFLRQAGDRLAETVVDTIQAKGKDVRLTIPGHKGFPEVLTLGAPFGVPEQRFDVATTVRLAGYHHLVQVSVRDVRVFERQTGIWWFRKMRYFVTVAASIDVYDTFTAAKVVSQVVEKTVQIDPNTYETFLDGIRNAFPAVDEAIRGIGRQFGRQAVGAIQTTPWKAAVTAIDGPHIILATGREAGPRVGDRWAVFEGRRTIAGHDGERFLVPGYKVGVIEVVATADGRVQAIAKDGGDFQVGDIAVPVK